MKEDLLHVEYLGVGGLIWYLLVAEIDRTTWDFMAEKITEKVDIGRFSALFYPENALFLCKKLKNDLGMIETRSTRFLKADTSYFLLTQLWATSVDQCCLWDNMKSAQNHHFLIFLRHFKEDVLTKKVNKCCLKYHYSKVHHLRFLKPCQASFTLILLKRWIISKKILKTWFYVILAIFWLLSFWVLFSK